MLETLADIREMIKLGLYKDEQHVRFAIVGRICEKLGWNIWNPAEFFTEYSVNKYPPSDITSQLRGKVDVALFLADKGSQTAEVFIEVKNMDRLSSDLEAAEEQLQRYTFWDRVAICVLTDGVSWRFYYSFASGTFADALFNEFNLLEDDLDSISHILHRVLSRKNYRQKAVSAAEEMLKELSLIRKIQAVKDEAIRISSNVGFDVHETAKGLLFNQERISLDLETIKRLWDKSLPGCSEEPVQTQTSHVPIKAPKGDVIEVSMQTKGCLAKGSFNIKTKETIIFKGSEASTHQAPSFSGYELDYKNRLIESGDLYLNDDGTKWIFRRDAAYTAPSTAASIIRGSFASGYTDWRDSEGRNLRHYLPKKDKPMAFKAIDLPKTGIIDVSMTTKGCLAKGSFDIESRKTIVFKGSEAVLENAPSFGSTGLRIKNELIAAGDLYPNADGTKLLFRRDIVFTAPSTAASIIKGRNTNGYTNWKDKDGKIIDHYFPRSK